MMLNILAYPVALLGVLRAERPGGQRPTSRTTHELAHQPDGHRRNITLACENPLMAMGCTDGAKPWLCITASLVEDFLNSTMRVVLTDQQACCRDRSILAGRTTPTDALFL